MKPFLLRFVLEPAQEILNWMEGPGLFSPSAHPSLSNHSPYSGWVSTLLISRIDYAAAREVMRFLGNGTLNLPLRAAIQHALRMLALPFRSHAGFASALPQ